MPAGRGAGMRPRVLEVLNRHPHVHCQAARILTRQTLGRRDTPETGQAGFTAQFDQVRSNEAMRPCSHRGTSFGDVLLKRHFSRMDAQDLETRLHIRWADVYFAIEATGASERGIERFELVRRSDHHNAVDLAQTVHEREQLRYRADIRMASEVSARPRDRIDFVDTDDRRRVMCSFAEKLAQRAFRFAVQRAHDLRAVHVIEADVQLLRERARHMRLSRAGRSVQDDAPRRLDTEFAIDAGQLQGQLNEIQYRAQLRVESTDIIEANVELNIDVVLVRLDEKDVAAGADVAWTIISASNIEQGARTVALVTDRQVDERAGRDDRAILGEVFLQVLGQVMRAEQIERRLQKQLANGLGFEQPQLNRHVEPRAQALTEIAIAADVSTPRIFRIWRDYTRKQFHAFGGSDFEHGVDVDAMLLHEQRIQRYQRLSDRNLFVRQAVDAGADVDSRCGFGVTDHR